MRDGNDIRSSFNIYSTILQLANDDFWGKKRKENKKTLLVVPLNELDPVGHLVSHLYVVQAFPRVLNTVT